MKALEILNLIATFKKNTPFILHDLKSKYPEEGNRIFSVGVLWGKIEPNWEYKPIGQDSSLVAYLPSGAVLSTPYFVFV